MSVAGATGPAPYRPATAQSLDQTELEMLESRRQAERRAARLGVSPENSDGAANPFSLGETINAGITGVVTAQSPVVTTVAPPNGGKPSGVIDPAEIEADFLRRVVPWPQDGAPGVINMHWTFPNHGGVGGKPFKQLDDFCQFIAWANNQPDKIKDIYFCLSQQAQTGPVHNGRAKVLRNTKNATSLKAIWLDLDGNKTDPKKGYPSQAAALAALDKFLKASGYPFPTAIINSGNGYHVYWISNKPLTVDEWRPYAEALWQATQQHGLVCDPVTTDVVRILRVPGTLNHKQAPPKKVEIVHLDPTDCDFTKLAKVAVQAPITAKVTMGLAGKPDAVFAGLTPEPFTGIATHDRTPLDPVPAIENCPMLLDALHTGGKDHSQGLWNLTVLATTFFQNGHKLAHQLSSGHFKYTYPETEAMWERKLREREDGLGWPSCRAIQNEGCKLCATCKHYGTIKSPLNLALPTSPVSSAALPTSPANGATDIKIDWTKVKSTGGWLKSVADLPGDAPAKLRHIIGHTGTLKQLNDQLITTKLLEKAYRSWSEVTLALAADLKSSGSYTPEQIAEALLANLPCNRHVANQTDKQRAIERAISRSHGTTLVPMAGVRFRDFDRSGEPKPSLANAVIAIRALGIEASYDLFHHRINVTYKGEAHTIREGLLTDDTVSAARSLINNTYGIDCGDLNTLAAIKEISFENAYDPVLDMLNECRGKWDGKKRLDTWVIDYLGCEDTPLNRAIGRIVPIAACRRARKPGCKFDNITVLEGPEGTGKSTAIRLLAGDENFSDQSILGAKDKEVQEQLDGVWMHENADLAGMRRAEIEHVKAFASRQVDRARPAYGRVREDRPRRSIEWGTTNNKEYLLSQTGNRRFWPLETGKIDIEALKRDREQLLGEAATYEAVGERITLDPSLWGGARDAQEQRRVKDPWEDLLGSMPECVEANEGRHSTRTVTIIHCGGDGCERVASADVLTHVLQIPRAQQTLPRPNGLPMRWNMLAGSVIRPVRL